MIEINRHPINKNFDIVTYRIYPRLYEQLNLNEELGPQVEVKRIERTANI